MARFVSSLRRISSKMHLTLNIIHVHEAQKPSEQGEQESESARARTSRRDFFLRLPSQPAPSQDSGAC